MEGSPRLIAVLLYGAGLRLMECLRLRVKDVDFAANQIIVRDGKGQKDRITMLPVTVKEPLTAHLNRVRRLHQQDLHEGYGRVQLPGALARKYLNADREWGWQWVFPAPTRYFDAQAHTRRRHHLHETVMQKAMRQAVQQADIAKPATPPHVATLFCHAPARGRVRHPDYAGAIGPQGPEHDHDLHARTEPGRSWGA